MVRVELGQFGEVYPLQTMLFEQVLVVVFHIDECAIGHRDDSFAWVAVDFAEGSHLPHVELFQSCQIEQHAVGSFVEAFVGTDKSSVERPFAAPWVHLPAADEQLELVLVESKHDAIDRDPDF